MLNPSQDLAYLRALTGQEDPIVHAQTVPDRPGAADAQSLHGYYSDLRGTLQDFNTEHSGVFVAVNEIAGNRRLKEHVTRVRALFVDDDNGTLDPKALPVKPSIIVRSRAGHHCYWLVSDCSLEDFIPAARALARVLKTDPKVATLERILRIPGYNNWKEGAQFQVTLVEAHPELVYKTADVLAGLGVDITEEDRVPLSTKKDAPPVVGEAPAGPVKLSRVQELLLETKLFKWAVAKANFVNRTAWFGLATNLVASAQREGALDAKLLASARVAFHHVSKPYLGYDAHATDAFFDDVVRHFSGPVGYTVFAKEKVPADVCKPGDGEAWAPIHDAWARWRAEREGDDPPVMVDRDARLRRLEEAGL